ncbi:unnamed protein product, partial [Cylindrotheca closterium]
AHNLTAEARQIVCAQQKAAVTGTQSRKMLLELKHGYVSRSATPSVMITSPEYIEAKAANGANSSAADFIQWLQTRQWFGATSKLLSPSGTKKEG